MTKTGSVDFFISYANDDKDPQWAVWIAGVLEAEGYTTRSQAVDFRPGGNFVDDMDQYLYEARRLIMVLSPAYLDESRGMVRAEWTAKFVQDPVGRDRALIPLMVRSCQPKGLLGPRNYVSLLGLSDDEARKAVLEGVDRRRRSTNNVPFPG